MIAVVRDRHDHRAARAGCCSRCSRPARRSSPSCSPAGCRRPAPARPTCAGRPWRCSRGSWSWCSRGGSYWLHYLMGLVPGLVLLTAAAPAAAARTRLCARRTPSCAVSTAVALTWVLVHPIERPEQPGGRVARRARAARRHRAWSRSAAPNILQATGLRSPYPDLWSLPVRVHDPELRRPRRAARRRRTGRPGWSSPGTSLGTWGVDATDRRPGAGRALRPRRRPPATGRSTARTSE